MTQTFEDLLKSARSNARRLYAPEGPISDPQMKELAEALKHSTNLTLLNLKESHISDQGAEYLAEALKGNKTLHHLELSKNRIGDAGAIALADALTTCPKLRSLGLAINQIGDAGATALADILIENTKLERLTLPRNQITDAGAIELAKNLRINDNLIQLSLSGNQISDAGGRALGDALQINDTLQELHLSDNQLGDTAGRALAEALHSNQSLHMLLLSQNPLSDTALIAFAGALQTNDAMEHLKLPEGSAANPEWHTAFETLIPHNTTLIEPPFIAISDTPEYAIDKHCISNREKADDGFNFFSDEQYSIYDLNKQQWEAFTPRLPIIIRRCENYFSPSAAQRVQQFQAFLEQLPEFDINALTSPEALAAHYDDPRLWHQLDEVLAALNANGHRLNASELLNEDGSAGPFLAKAVELYRHPELFTRDNWLGASKAELNAVLNALPENALEAVENRQQLALALERSALANQIER